MAEPITQVLGVVGIKTRGEYDSETTYEKLNVVTYNGNSYCAKTDTQGNLPTNTLYWDLMVEKGEKGDMPVKGVDYWNETDKAEIEADLALDVTSEVTEQLSNLTSATPLVASSTSGMTDTTRIYVNTTDGHWYWYNGSNWTDGGVYQAAEDSNTLEAVLNEVGTLNTLGKYYGEIEKKSFNTTSIVWDNNNKVLSMINPKLLDKDIVVVCNAGYLLSIQLWNSDVISSSSYVSSSEWRYSYIIPANTYFTFSLKKINSQNLNIDEIINIYENKYNIVNDIESNKDNLNEVKNGIETFIHYSPFISGGLTRGEINQYGTDVSSVNIMKFDRDIVLNVESGFRYGVHTFVNGVYNSDSGWKSGKYTVPANTEFRIAINKINSSSKGDPYLYPRKVYFSTKIKSEFDSINEEFNNIDDEIRSINEAISGITSGNNLDDLYDINLNQYDFLSSWFCGADNPSQLGTQGFAIYDDYIVQLHGNVSEIRIYQISTGTRVSILDSSNLNIGHGDCIQISDTKYNENDLFPIIYITKDSTPAVVQTIRISDLSTVEKLKTYTFGNASEIGYYAGHVCDFKNNILYQIGYKENSYTSPTDNSMIVTVYDMTQETLISDNNYSLQLIDSWTLPFIYTCQGQKFFDNKIIIVSSYNIAYQENRIYIIDPVRKSIVKYYNKFDSPGITNYEMEDIDFVLDSTTKKYKLIAGCKSGYWALSKY